MKSRYTRLRTLDSLVIYLIIITIMLLLVGCNTAKEKIHGKTYPNYTLIEQTLKPRIGFEGKLTFRRCTKYRWKKCQDEYIFVYDIENRKTRNHLNDLNFRCRIGSKRYKICKDKPGLCHFKNCKSKFWSGERTCSHEYIGIFENYKFLLNARLRCRSEI